MPSLERAVISWSTGKDSAWALERVRSRFDVVALLSTVDGNTGRIPVHNTPAAFIERQAESVGLPLWTVPLPQPCSNAEYLRRLGPAYARATSAGATKIVFGDLFLRDIRDFRETSLRGTGLTPDFPLWNLPTRMLATQMIDGGLRATITCVDKQRLDQSFAGRNFEPAALPPDVDPCGENGEFHTFATDGPMFRHSVRVTVESIRQDANFAYAELVPGR